MKKIVFSLILILLTTNGWSQETNRHQISTAPATARYEIVQSELGVKLTFKLDKYTGKVYQLSEKSDGNLAWLLMLVESQSDDEIIPGKVNYQIFTSGLGVRMTFLLNVNTGKVWWLVEDSLTGLFWSPM